MGIEGDVDPVHARAVFVPAQNFCIWLRAVHLYNLLNAWAEWGKGGQGIYSWPSLHDPNLFETEFGTKLLSSDLGSWHRPSPSGLKALRLCVVNRPLNAIHTGSELRSNSVNPSISLNNLVSHTFTHSGWKMGSRAAGRRTAATS